MRGLSHARVFRNDPRVVARLEPRGEADSQLIRRDVHDQRAFFEAPALIGGPGRSVRDVNRQGQVVAPRLYSASAAALVSLVACRCWRAFGRT